MVNVSPTPIQFIMAQRPALLCCKQILDKYLPLMTSGCYVEALLHPPLINTDISCGVEQHDEKIC